MGIDRHELEHRNWRPAASKTNNELDRKLAEELDSSIVPDEGERSQPRLNPQKAKRVKIEQS